MTNNLSSIYSDFRVNYVDTPEFVIDFYDRNFVLLNNINQFSTKPELHQYIEIVGKYAEAIYRKHRYNATIDFIDKQQLLVDTEIYRLNANDVKDSWYHSLQFVKGMASYELKDYKTANTVFKKLVQLDNQNDLYRSWLNYSESGLKIWFIRIVNIVCFGLLAIGIIFNTQIGSYYVHQTLVTIGVLGLFSTLIYEAYIKRGQRKRKAN